MKNWNKAFTAIFISLFILVLSAPDAAYAATVKLNKSKVELQAGDTYKLKLSEAGGTVKWTSSKASVAKVSSKGKVTAVKKGKATITATYKSKKYKCAVTVKEKSLSEHEKSEVLAAEQRGLVTEELAKEYSRPVYRYEMVEMIVNCVRYLGFEPDQNLSNALTNTNSNPITRDEAAILLTDAMMETLGIMEYNGAPKEYAHGLSSREMAEAQAKGEDFVYHTMLCGQYDLISGLPMMEMTSDYYFRSNELMTVLEAIQAVYRLSNSIEEKPEYIDMASITERLSYDGGLIQKAREMPEVNDKLFDFEGIDLPNSQAGSPHFFIENDVILLKELGFNFTRAAIDFSLISNPDNPMQINMVYLRNIDSLVSWAMKHQIHLCLSLFLWDGELYDEVTPTLWSVLANRYAGVPGNVLSFNLLNEPYSIENQAELEELYKKSIDIIHGYNSDRIVFIDSLLNNNESYLKMGDGWYPLENMAEEKVVFSYHYYQPENVLGTGAGYPPQNQWPFPFVNGTLGGIDEGAEPLMIEGDFKKGDQITVRVNFVANQGGLRILLDGEEICRQEFEQTGDVSIDIVAKVPKAGNRIAIAATGAWCRLSYVVVTYGEAAASPIPYYENDWIPEFYSENKITNIICSIMDSVGITPSHVIIASDGSYSCVGNTMTEYDADYMRGRVKIWADFSKQFDKKVMLHELTMYSQYPSQNLHLGLLDDYLTILDEYDISWSTWDGERLFQGSYNYNESNTTWVKKGIHYVNKELLEVLQSHMED